MITVQTMTVKRTLLLLTAMVAALIAASGVALAVNKVCPSVMQANSCTGTKTNDTLIGTSGPDDIKGLAGNDKISGGADNDTTNGGSGNDTYSYTDGWGTDTLTDGSGIDTLNFSAVATSGNGVFVQLSGDVGGANYVQGPNGEWVNLPSGTPVIEKVKGSAGLDTIRTGAAANTLQPGPGTGGAYFEDYGGCTSGWYCDHDIPASSDTYSGFAASGYGYARIEDWGGMADKLILPFASTDVYFEAYNHDNDPADDDLIIMTSSTDKVWITGQLEPVHVGNGQQRKGRIESIQFTDTTLAIGSETPQPQTLSGAKTTGNAEEQVQKLNEASNLDEAEKEKRSNAAKKTFNEYKEKA